MHRTSLLATRGRSSRAVTRRNIGVHGKPQKHVHATLSSVLLVLSPSTAVVILILNPESYYTQRAAYHARRALARMGFVDWARTAGQELLSDART